MTVMPRLIRLQLLLVALALLLTACKRPRQDDFAVVVTAVNNQAGGAEVSLELDAPRSAEPVTTTWSTPSGTFEGNTITLTASEDFAVTAEVTTNEGEIITVPSQVGLRNIVMRGTNGPTTVTDFRDAFTGTYQTLYLHHHHNDINGTVLMDSAASSVTISKTFGGRLTEVDIRLATPTLSFTLPLLADGRSYWGLDNYLRFEEGGDSIALSVSEGGLFSYETYSHHGRR